jgi:hypothetical protein
MTRRWMVAVGITAAFVAAGICLVVSLRPRVVATDEAVARTRQLVARAGGAASICEEAAALFHRFGGNELKIFREQDLNDSRSIKTLGKVGGIWPTMDDSFIKVRVGTHFKGFEIHIFATSLTADVAAFLHERQVDGCIYVLD